MAARDRVRGARSGAAALAVAAAIAAWPAPAADRVVAVGDLHGNLEAITVILGETGLVDRDLRWTGGEATLVQLGDIVDRAPRLREVLDLLMRLEGEAAAAGGRVVVLLGNHEVKDLLGVLNEVDPRSYATFVDGRSEERRREAFAEYRRFLRAQARALGAPRPAVSDELERRWYEAHPLGKVEYLEAFGPDGDYGRWLRERPAVAVLGDTLFVHGGLGPAVKGIGPDEINRRVREELAAFDRVRSELAVLDLVQPTSSIHLLSSVVESEIERADELGSDPSPGDRRRALRTGRMRELVGWRSWLIVDPAGPLWNGAPSFWDEDADAAELEELLAGFGVRRMVVGHIPRRDGRILARFEGRLLVIDTLMELWPERGRPSALELEDGVLTAVYPGERVTLTASAAP